MAIAGEYTTGTSGAFDAHAHLDHLDDEALVDGMHRARSRGISGWAVSASDPAHWSRLLAVCSRVGALPQVGLHPWWAGRLDDAAQDALLERLSEIVTPHGLGETGLDWSRARDGHTRRRQIRAFHAQVQLARQRDIPLVLHGVRAWGLVLDGLPKRCEGVLHGFTGSPEVAERAVRIGLYVSFGPALHHSHRARAAAKVVPLERLLVETDAPDQAPVDSLFAQVEFIAALRGVSVAQVVEHTGANARSVFRCPE